MVRICLNKKSFMLSHDEYPGYVALPKTLPRKSPMKPARKAQKASLLNRVPEDRVRLGFNYRIVSDLETSKMLGFSMRLFTPKFFDKRKERTEIGVHLRPEEWVGPN